MSGTRVASKRETCTPTSAITTRSSSRKLPMGAAGFRLVPTLVRDSPVDQRRVYGVSLCVWHIFKLCNEKLTCSVARGCPGNFHEINYRDKVTLGVMIERLRQKNGLQRKHFDDLPFNVVLDDWGW